MILPEVRDPRLVTVRRGGSLTDAHHHLLALWAAERDGRLVPGSRIVVAAFGAGFQWGAGVVEWTGA